MDVRLIEPETARPEEPKQQTIRKNVLFVIGAGIAATVVLLLFTGGNSGPDASGANVEEPVVVASRTLPLLEELDDGQDDFSLLEQGYQIDTTALPPTQEATPTSPAFNPPQQATLPPGQSYGRPSHNPWIASGPPPGSYQGYGGYNPPPQDPELQAALKSDPLVFENRREKDLYSEEGSRYSETDLRRAPYRLLRGTVIPAMLITDINSQRPGIVLAQVTRDVYDATVEHVLIPQGSRLVGNFENIRQADQEHVVLSWSRIVLPDGKTIELPDFQAMEAGGESGLAANVKRPWGGAIRQLALASVFMVGGLYAANQVAGGADDLVTGFLVFQLVNKVLDTGEKLLGLNKQLNVKISVPAGYRFNAYAVDDIPIDRVWNR